VRLLDHVGRRELRSLYTGALCFVFPSLYEGFGLPPLEAMSFDVPVITSNVASLPELCGKAALYVDPYSTDELRRAIERMISDEELRRRCVDAGRERIAFFSMDNCTARLTRVLQRLGLIIKGRIIRRSRSRRQPSSRFASLPPRFYGMMGSGTGDPFRSVAWPQAGAT
jgi:3-deoxy-D-manno-octulosonic-acid transferase